MAIASQIAAALEEAHGSGVIHRDLKPANIRVTEDGKIKVFDFGLARAFSDEAVDADSSVSPTLTRDIADSAAFFSRRWHPQSMSRRRSNASSSRK